MQRRSSLRSADCKHPWLASQQDVPELKAALDQATAARQRAAAQSALAQQTYDREAHLLSKQVVAQATVDTAKRNLDAAIQRGGGARRRRARTAGAHLYH